MHTDISVCRAELSRATAELRDWYSVSLWRKGDQSRVVGLKKQHKNVDVETDFNREQFCKGNNHCSQNQD